MSTSAPMALQTARKDKPQQRMSSFAALHAVSRPRTCAASGTFAAVNYSPRRTPADLALASRQAHGRTAPYHTPHQHPQKRTCRSRSSCGFGAKQLPKPLALQPAPLYSSNVHPTHLQISLFLRLAPSSAKWLPKCTSLKICSRSSQSGGGGPRLQPVLGKHAAAEATSAALAGNPCRQRPAAGGAAISSLYICLLKSAF